MLYAHLRYKTLAEVEPGRAPSLVLDIVNKASGVFFWVFSVVESSLEGFSNRDRISDLQRRIQALPGDLEEYFGYILEALDPIYLPQASRVFRFALEAERPLPLLTFLFVTKKTRAIS